MSWRSPLPLLALLALALASCEVSPFGGKGVVDGVEAIVFVRRPLRDEAGAGIQGPNAAGLDSGGTAGLLGSSRYVAGASLVLLRPAGPQGQLTDLSANFPEADFRGLDTSFDGEEVVFSMRTSPRDYFHLYVVSIAGQELRQLTFGPYDDTAPAYVSPTRIAFVTTEASETQGMRSDEYGGPRGAGRLAFVHAERGDGERRLCPPNMSGVADPFSMNDGRVGYSLWAHLGPSNEVELWSANPDCTDARSLDFVAASVTPGSNALVQARASGDELVMVATRRRGTFGAGALVVRGASGGFTSLTPGVPRDGRESAEGRYRDPTPLPEGGLLVSWAPGSVDEGTFVNGDPPDFGLYRFDPESGRRTLVWDEPDFVESMPRPAVVREPPPEIPDAAPAEVTTIHIGGTDVAATALADEVVSGGQFDATPVADALRETVAMRIIEGYGREVGPIREHGLGLLEGGAILGEATVHGDGSWSAEVPAHTPVRLQPLDRFGMAIRSELRWFTGAPGEDRSCGGCHEGSAEVAPRAGDTTQADAREPELLVPPIGMREEVAYDGAGMTIQSIFTSRCAQCHDGSGDPEAIPLDPTPDPLWNRSYSIRTNGGNFSVPVLRLTGGPSVGSAAAAAYPLSYVSLVYPAAMMADSRPGAARQWVAPGSARRSRLVQVLDIDAADDPGTWAFGGSPHPEDVGGELTREERLMIIRWIDLGANYWTRTRVEGGDEWAAR